LFCVDKDQTLQVTQRLLGAPSDYVHPMPDLRPGTATIAAKTLARVKARGIGEVTSLAASRVRESFYSSDRLIILRRRLTGDERAPQRDDLSFKRADPSDGPTYAGDIGTDSASTFAARLTDSTRCYIVLDNSIIVHATWVTAAAAWTREVRRYFRPPEGGAYVYESFTRPEVRGRGVYPFALKSIAAAGAAESIQDLWIGVEAHNLSSYKAVTKAGFQPVFEVEFRRRLGRLDLRVGPGAPRGTFVRSLRA
jgi:hypothetical protein